METMNVESLFKFIEKFLNFIKSLFFKTVQKSISFKVFKKKLNQSSSTFKAFEKKLNTENNQKQLRSKKRRWKQQNHSNSISFVLFNVFNNFDTE